MSEWKEFKFSDFVLMNPSVKLPANQQVSFVEMKDLEDGKRYCYPSSTRLNGSGAKFENGDTLFARITPCLENGKICQVKGLKNGIGLGSTEFLVFRGKPKVSVTDFVFYISRWNEVRSHAEINLDGTSGRQRVPKECFNELILNLPANLSEQTAITSILSSLDDKIDLLHRQNATLEKMAETLFRQWFVERESLNYDSNDFYDGNEFKNQGNQPNQKNQGSDNVEEAKEEWEMGKLGKWIKETVGGEWGKENAEGDFNKIVYCIRGTDIADLNTGLPEKTPIRFVKETKFKS
jgi:type I restriction enzyme S subunit